MSTFAWGPASMRLYPHVDLPAPAVVDELRAQAALAAEHGFAGVMVSEHHGGFEGYIPDPLQLAGWLLDAMPSGWAAACPLILPLRPAVLVAEEVAWLAARFPDRVAVGFAAGALPRDFEIMGVSMDDLTARFASALATVSRILRGGAAGVLAHDPAIARLATRPVPVLSAAASKTAARRAARLGIGVLFDSLSTTQRCRELSDAYRAAGGSGPCILVRRAWLGEPPRVRVARQVEVYRGYAAPSAQAHWQGDQLVAAGTGRELADALRAAVDRAGCDGVNLRVHVSGVAPEDARDQIRRLGDEVLPLLTG